MHIEATTELKNDLKRRTKPLWYQEEPRTWKDWKNMSKVCCAAERDGTVEVHTWIADVPRDALKGLPKEEDLPQWTKHNWEIVESRVR